jgi:hypothetical protein
VAGLDARPSGDGRLLGHFPYPEARPDQLATLAPGVELRPEAAESLRALQRDAQAQGVRDQYAAIVSIYKAMGGGWMAEQDRARSSQPVAKNSEPEIRP